MIYGGETWATTKEENIKIRHERRMLRWSDTER